MFLNEGPSPGAQRWSLQEERCQVLLSSKLSKILLSTSKSLSLALVLGLRVLGEGESMLASGT